MADIIFSLFVALFLSPAFALEGDDFSGRYFLKHVACLDSATPIEKTHYSKVLSPQVIIQIKHNSVIESYKDSNCPFEISYYGIFSIKDWSLSFSGGDSAQASKIKRRTGGCGTEVILKHVYGDEITQRSSKIILHSYDLPQHGKIELLAEKDKNDFFLATDDFYIESDPNGFCYLHFVRL